MRIFLPAALVIFFLASCKKDKYTTAPQIKYKSVNPNYVANTINSVTPVITFSVTDAEGDLGITSKDTAFIFLRNLLTGDSIVRQFPDLKDVSKSNFKADVLVSVGGLLRCPHAARLDTLYFEMYVTDFGKNKSNTIVTGDPIFNQCP